MPTLTLTVSYDGTDSEITQALGRMVSALGKDAVSSQAPSTAQPSGAFDATRFAAYVSGTRLEAVMKVWLRSGDGKAPLTELFKASGVKKHHDYTGIGAALTRNMIKAGFSSKKWYRKDQLTNGERIYEIQGELVEPLKRAFGHYIAKG